MFDKPAFYNSIRHSLFSGLSEGQVDGCEAILDAWLGQSAFTDDRWLAYMLATAFHETAATMQPVRETLAATDARAIAILDHAFAKGRLPWVKKIYWRKDAQGRSWLGRGLVQLTHKDNYQVIGRLIGVDLAVDPDAAMEMETAVKIMFVGMTAGSFTGRKLSDYFNGERGDWTGARAIINGRESAAKLAAIAEKFFNAIKEARS